jgi:hypothetical protein
LNNQNPTHLPPPSRTEETITNYEKHYVYNSRQPIQPVHEPTLFCNNPVGLPGSASWTLHTSMPNSFIEQMQAKNQLLKHSLEGAREIVQK